MLYNRLGVVTVLKVIYYQKFNSFLAWVKRKSGNIVHSVCQSLSAQSVAKNTELWFMVLLWLIIILKCLNKMEKKMPKETKSKLISSVIYASANITFASEYVRLGLRCRNSPLRRHLAWKTCPSLAPQHTLTQAWWWQQKGAEITMWNVWCLETVFYGTFSVVFFFCSLESTPAHKAIIFLK